MGHQGRTDLIKSKNIDTQKDVNTFYALQPSFWKPPLPKN